MNCTACSRWRDDYVDGVLSTDNVRAFETHLSGCAACRATLDSLRTLRRLTQKLPREIAPTRDLWTNLKTEIASPASSARSDASAPLLAFRPAPPTSFLNWFAPLALAASVALLATFAERHIKPPTADGWAVAAVSGTPRVDARDVRHDTRMRVGQWLETDEAARAKVVVGTIGEVSVEPNSRLRLVGMAATDHRLELARGTMSAMIFAPPRLFFVNTPSATAVDLGCAYTLTVADNGDGELHVTSGFVSLEDRGRESIIRTGMMCLTRNGVGPGTPFAVDAPDALRAALTRFDFDQDATDAALRDILTLARPDDAITVWHLLDRTNATQRAAVFDVLARFAPPPGSVTRAGILAGDKTMTRTWGTDLGIDRF